MTEPVPLISTFRSAFGPDGGIAGAADGDVGGLAGQVAALETAEAADVHVQVVGRTAGGDVPGSAQVDGQVVGGQVRQGDRPGAADGDLAELSV